MRRDPNTSAADHATADPIVPRTRRRPWAVVIGVSALLAATGCGKLEPNGGGSREDVPRKVVAEGDTIKRACASNSTYDRLKELAFDEARRVRNAESPNFERLAAASVIRMEDPVVKSRDEVLNVTVCTGRLVLELPPGTAAAFGGERRLAANVEYAAQAAVDGSGLVYQMDGAEPIVYRLAAFDLRRSRSGAAAPLPAPTMAEAVPERVSVPDAEPEAIEEAVARPRVMPPPVVRRAEPDDEEEERPRAVPVRAEAPVPTARPSFNCRYARSRVEKMICSDDRLAAQDRRMAALYYGTLASSQGETRRFLQSSRNSFVRARDSCTSAACVARSYDVRIAELSDVGGQSN